VPEVAASDGLAAADGQPGSAEARTAYAPMRELLTGGERRRLMELVLALPALGMIDALGLALVIAIFLHVVGIHELRPFHAVHAWLGQHVHAAITERSLGLMLLALIALTRFGAGMFTQYLIFRFCYSVQTRLSADFMRTFLATDIEYIARKDKAFGVQIVFNECARYASGVLLNGLQIAYESLTLLVFLLVLIYASPIVSLLFILVAAVVFLIVRQVSEKFTQRLGKQRLRLDGVRFSLIGEAFQGFEEVAAYGLAPGLVGRYERATSESLHATLLQQLLNLFPKNLFELLVVAALLAIAAMVRGPMPPNVIAMMALLLGAAFRCMPSINRILSSRQLIAFEIPVVRELATLRDESGRALRPQRAAAAATTAPARAVRIPPVHVCRKRAGEVFRLDVQALELGPEDLVLIMGDSGCGKTTYLACVAGLLGAAERAAGPPLRVSYAPQAPFVLNDTLAGNITLAGYLAGKAVDEARLAEAVRVAQLLQPGGDLPIIPLQTQLDGSGASLSGGQRQRISLARALYFESELLILDEVTSALDEATEEMFLDAYRGSFLRRPTLFVTHRSRLMPAATRVYRLENGELI
jgi:ABC-type bacteriocin/lantibiotic exporter with double-glycine peptidase domain